MNVGVTLWFQNQPDFHARGKTNDYSMPSPVTDHECYRDELRLADLIEPLGYDSMWTIEHHFGPYGMATSPLSIFNYMAGRTERIDFGAMVMVLPWHDPLRVAEGVAQLDNLLNLNGQDRKFWFGFGRGAAEQEFNAFRVDYEQSRLVMDEALEIIRRGLTDEWFEFEGEYFNIPRTSIRPRPVSADLTKNMLVAWSSQESMEWGANTGAAQLYNNFHRWEQVTDSSAAFNQIRAGHGWDPVPPVCVGSIYCTDSKQDAEDTRRYRRDVVESSVWHYGILRQPSLKNMLEGKEGAELEATLNKIYDGAMHAGVHGTPDECIEQLTKVHERLDLGRLIAHFNFGRLPVDKAEKSMRLFAEEVLPALEELPSPIVEATPYAQVRANRIDDIELASQPLEFSSASGIVGPEA